MKRFGGKRSRPSPAMNVTPLVDIVLVLLIIFMVVLPSMENDAPVDLPSIFHVDEDPRGRTDPITVSITADRRLFLEQDEMPRDALESRLREIHASEPTRRVILRGDSTLRYEEVRSLFRMCQQIGLPGVSLRVGERGGEGESEG
ncbi:ExbD/TolR family protein [Sandaracinus amylolyticus]|uniref:Biopolymer transport protein ExbD/TolR n=1 Tax=Sandaracinus amylolyticus TaxID=927083 RepID=A0A0F6YHN2_9BACT|nr:biopolymer transporter ExbD [Sandaracinus amylolyticus]AKF04885.1 Biopolymer transport protein ExbD/TolR [Sandaracinus amylolyticus]